MTSYSVPRRLDSLLASHRELRPLIDQVARLAAMQRCLVSLAPAALARGCQIVQFQQQILTIAATSGAVAAKLRAMSGRLVSLFVTNGYDVSGIRVVVQVSPPRPTAAPAKRQLGPVARQALRSLADKLPDGLPLRQTVYRLSCKP